MSAHKKKSLNNFEMFAQQKYERISALGANSDAAQSTSHEVKSAAAAALVKEVMRKRVMKQK